MQFPPKISLSQHDLLPASIPTSSTSTSTRNFHICQVDGGNHAFNCPRLTTKVPPTSQPRPAAPLGKSKYSTEQEHESWIWPVPQVPNVRSSSIA